MLLDQNFYNGLCGDIGVLEATRVQWNHWMILATQGSLNDTACLRSLETEDVLGSLKTVDALGSLGDKGSLRHRGY